MFVRRCTKNMLTFFILRFLLETELLREDLADLSTEISIKQKLIEELENSQKRLNNMKVHYEEKLSLLERKIKETETERDRVLDTVQEHDKEAAQQSQKIKAQYEKKINDFKDELKKLQSAKKEHNRLMRTKVRCDGQSKRLSPLDPHFRLMTLV